MRWTWQLLVIGAAIAILGCGRRVSELVPIAHPADPDDHNCGYVEEFRDQSMLLGLERQHMTSPDGTHTLEIVSDRALLGGPSSYHGIELVNVATQKRVPILSLWDADMGSGIAINFRWSADSRALRMRGSTRGYRRRSMDFRYFDLLYLVERGNYVDFCGSCQKH